MNFILAHGKLRYIKLFWISSETPSFLVAKFWGGGWDGLTTSSIREEASCHQLTSVHTGIGWKAIIPTAFQHLPLPLPLPVSGPQSSCCPYCS